MSRLTSGVAGIVAAAVTFGVAFHLEQASGSEARSLSAMLHDYGLARSREAAPEIGVNREAKADRAAAPRREAGSRTVAVTLVGLPGTSMLLRMPAEPGVTPVRAPARPRSAPRPPDGAATKRLIACEPIASILTDAGRSGMMGRCLA